MAQFTPFDKVRRRLIPFLFLLYIVAYLDRINVSFAALQMNDDLGFSSAVYGLGAGIFFLSYVLFEVPSNLILDRVGVRVWIARIMITWGIASSAMMFVQGAASFYVLRFVLGAAEAGFFPGIILYLTRWFPAAERARTIALFMTATALAGVVGGPLSGALLSLDGLGGLRGWQWLFLLEGLPAIVLGIAVLAWLPERPGDARWLSVEERDWIAARLAADEAQRPHAAAVHGHFAHALRSGRLWTLSALYFAIVVAFYGVSFWLPQILQAMSGMSDVGVTLLSVVPYATAAVGMVLIARASDRRPTQRARDVAACMAVGVAGFGAAALATTPGIALAALAVAALGIWGALGPFWAMPPAFLRGTAAAGGIAVINSVGNIGGFVAPSLVGAMRERTGSFSSGLWLLAACLAAGSVIALVLDRSGAAQQQPAAPAA